MTSDQLDTGDHHCKRCGDTIHVQEDRWFRHSWSEEKSREEIEEALDEDRELEDFFSEGAMLCPSCQADYLVFLGHEDAEGQGAKYQYIVYTMHEDRCYPTFFLETADDADEAQDLMEKWWLAFYEGEKEEPPNYGGVSYQHISQYEEWEDA